MKRLAAAFFLVAMCSLTVGAAPTSAAKHTPVSEVSAPGGLGNTRANFEHFYGKPASDLFDNYSKKTHSDVAEFHIQSSDGVVSVEFVVSKDNVLRPTDRAFDIIVLAPSDKTWTLTEADAVAVHLLPKDAKSRGDLAPTQTQFYSSASLAKAIPDKTWWRSDDIIGDFGVSLNLDSNGSWSAVTIGTDIT